ncbi:MAG: winged helix-turn-helix transcriptional regulator, partial [Dehalococcoidia bacterium]|nr:winged helix-turn-helix transcriptional regulator [Dehalococcoidia bacterium]
MTYSRTQDWLILSGKGILPAAEGDARASGSYLQYLPAIFRRELVVDTAAGKIWVAGRQVRLGEKEFHLLACLYRQQGRTVPETSIAVEVQVDREAIGDLVRRIRNVIESDPANPQFLKSMPGGYRLDTDEFMGRFLMIFESILKPLE